MPGSEKHLWTMMLKYAGLVLGLIACLAPASSVADKIGDPAAPLEIIEWMKGDPVDVKDGKNIYVLAFWAALSPASRASLPKLAELQKKLKDKGVVVLGISDEPVDRIREFIGMPEAQVEFSVAADDQRKTARKYMVAYGQNGIPYTFVVGRDGKVLWHGHPMAGLDKALDDIIAGRYDLPRAIKVDAVRAEVNDYQALVRQGDPKALDLGRKLLAARTNSVPQLCDLAYRIVTDVHNTNRDFALAGEALDMAQRLASSNTAPVILARGVMLFEQGKQDEGIALAKQAVELAKDPKEKAAIDMRLRVMEGRRDAEARNRNRPDRPPRILPNP